MSHGLISITEQDVITSVCEEVEQRFEGPAGACHCVEDVSLLKIVLVEGDVSNRM